MSRIEERYKENFNLIKKYKLKEGLILKLKKDFKHIDSYKKGDLITIKHIHKLYGWILFEEICYLPQTPREILKISEVATKENILKGLK